jgi:hypothetical protein
MFVHSVDFVKGLQPPSSPEQEQDVHDQSADAQPSVRRGTTPVLTGTTLSDFR